jgi:hypothetical protein
VDYFNGLFKALGAIVSANWPRSVNAAATTIIKKFDHSDFNTEARMASFSNSATNRHP